MPQFVFRYETLLNHRRDIEDQCQRELASQMRARMIMTDQLRGMQQDITDSKHRLGSSLVGKVDLSQVGDFTRYNQQATVRGRQLVKRIAEVEIKVVHARQQLLHATQQRKALELLRERDLKQWRKEMDRKETAELDELAAQAFIREDRHRELIEQQARLGRVA